MSAYIHIPFCLKRCFYCAFPVHVVGQTEVNQNYYKQCLEKQYIGYLIKDIQNHYQGEPLKTIYFGGGTPSLLSLESLQLILNCFKKQSNAEITIEADPKTFNKDKLQGFKSLGFNRLSVGIQSLQDETLQRLNRSHLRKDIDDALGMIEKVYGTFDNCSFDFLYNLPTEVGQSSLEDLKWFVEQFKPGHISAYSLSIEEESYFYKKLNYREGIHPLPNIEIQTCNYTKVNQILQQYDHYEISNFAKSEKHISQHNRNYWYGNSNFYGFGMGATSLQNLIRITRPNTLKKYYQFVESGEGCLIEDESSQFEKQRILLMSRLRTKWGIDKALLSQSLLEAMKKFEEYFIISEDNIKLKIPEGYLVCDEIVGYLQNIK
ncbi:unnamed protein product [Paramecium pentaurelia]|uniref:Radical S-adenosyl methionine domain-containing protein 1, mitochondrial n=1 Tax=Paramecium pentaurelia TaxID=43138 RepID=A0A8S1WTZ7_9CILI|nr:unnamed protein product [Paramecium pentaurelia]